jgi:signal transduction histidine kinase
MTEMINTLLDFTLVHATGKLPVAMVLIDLATVVREATDEARAGNPDRAIEVDMRGDLRGEWDPARMAQALSNLIGNAMSYGDPRTPVRVLADGDDSDVSLRVKNDGPQISPELIPVFFEPFQRGPRGTSPHHLGLGLYIVKQIVLAHRGTVDVDSSAESGTTFKMSLPRTRSPA